MFVALFRYGLGPVLLLFILLSNLAAQESHINFQRYTINEGLSQNSVFCLLQDKDGIIWMGTGDGLNKFDGYDFTHYNHEYSNPKSLSHNQVNALYEDKEGNIWVGTSDGLNIFDKKTQSFTRLVTTKNKQDGFNEYVTSIFEDKKGNLWLTGLEGLKLYHPKTKSFQLFNYVDNRRADLIMEDAQGLLWVSIDKDLRLFDPVKKRFLPLPALLETNNLLRKSFIRALKQDSYGQIWIGTETAGLFVYDTKNNTLQYFRNEKFNSNSLAVDIVREIYFHNSNEVWVGTRDGLSIFNRTSKQFTTYRNDQYDPSSISQNSVRSILKDRAGNVWLGTFAGGVNIVTTGQNMFMYLGAETPNKKGLSYRMVSSIISAPNGGLWIGTEGGGLNLSNKDLSVFKNYALPRISANITKNTIKCIFPEGDNLWVGTFKGLSFFNSSVGKLVEVPIPGAEVSSIVRTGDLLWIGTNGAGLISRDKNGRINVYKNNPADSNSLSRNNILKIVKDKDNNLWIATSRGLTYYDGKRFKQFHSDTNKTYSLSNSNIASLLIDRKGRLWVGTKGGGLNLFDKASGRFYAIDKKLGLANEVIQSIEEDDRGHFWVSTNKGLSKIRISAAPPFTRKSVSITNYFMEDGLQSNQFLPNSSFKNKNGELFFGGINGLTFFHPDKIKQNPYKPPVVFTEFMIRNKPVVSYSEDSPLKKFINETEEITLTYNQAFISFKFAALNYVNPSKNKYAYKLEGFNRDEDWHYVGNQRISTYTNLDAGTYTFMVKAANNDGVWNNTAKTIRITVLPPWWETWWAYTLYALILASLLYLYYTYSINTARLKSELVLEHLVREKDHELYQRKLNFFTNISHEIKTPLTLILAPLEKLLDMSQGNNRIQRQLILMKRNGERLVRLINQLLDFRKFESGNMEIQAAQANIVTFTKEVLHAFDAYAKHLNIQLRFESDKKIIQVWFDHDKLEKIFYNLLSNALKFTRPEGEIVVRIKQVSTTEGEGFVLIEVEDNGSGISPDKISTIFDQFKHFDEDGANLQGSGIGLAFTKGLVEMQNGEISVHSQPETEEQNGKTCFTIKLPLGRTHLKDEEILTDYKDSESIEEYAVDEKVRVSETFIQRTAKVLSDMGESPVMLIVEDNKDVMDFLKEHFEEKFHIHTAFDGEEGVEKAIAIIPDIIISDVMMPKMSGTTLCDTLKKDNRTSHIPIILLTARTQTIHKVEGLETGADDYITKPFSVTILEARMWNLLEQRQQLRERYRKEITLQPTNLAITSPDEEFLEKIMAYIEKNIADPGLNVEDLAKEVFMSRTTLYRKIKALTNQTAVEFIRSVRLKRAAQLLKTHHYNVNEIAYMAGFTDIDYFRKCFKEQYKKSPTDYAEA